MSDSVVDVQETTGTTRSNNITVCLNEIRGYADAFIEVGDKFLGTTGSEYDEQVRNTCNKVCDKIGFIDEDAQPDFFDYDFFKGDCMDNLVLYAKTDSSPLRYIDISVSIYDMKYNHFIELMRYMAGNIRLSIIGPLKVVSSTDTVMSFQFKLNLLDWTHLYKIIKSKYKDESNANHALFKVLDNVADHLQVANPYFTREFFEELQL